MVEISYNSSPAEQIVSAFCAGRSGREALNIGLRALVESAGCERGALYLISKNGLVELSNQYTKSTGSCDFEPRASSLQAGMAIVLSCAGPGRLDILERSEEALEEWQDYLELCGDGFEHHAVIFLIAPMGHNFGFLSLAGNEPLAQSESVRERIVHTAQAMTMLIDYMRLTSASRNKIG
jgi:hypothetical protein